MTLNVDVYQMTADGQSATSVFTGSTTITGSMILDSNGLSAREIADQLGHARPSITLDRYMGRKAVSERGAKALEALG